MNSFCTPKLSLDLQSPAVPKHPWLGTTGLEYMTVWVSLLPQQISKHQKLLRPSKDNFCSQASHLRISRLSGDEPSMELSCSKRDSWDSR